ncbi:integrase arm-type DNA-binding domain-containing protein [Fontisubflavum oceani]|uniref:integrase arm-type DNA-binding domain-containing protein n=1 Tax=Fontisubflavum oceani TaxID=2978973 RepID=UPI0038B2E4DF
MPKLTAQFVGDLSFARAGQSMITDGALRGFGVRVGTRSKSYFAESRVKGRTRCVTIGWADTLTLNDARKLAEKALVEMADCKDRNVQLGQDRAKLMTLGQAADGWLSERAHSLRAGLSTSGIKAGVPTHKVRAQTGHASDLMLSRDASGAVRSELGRDVAVSSTLTTCCLPP